MTLFRLFADIRELLKQGNALKSSGFLVNVEATAAAIYGFLNALILFLNDLGFPVQVGGTDLHVIANGWAATGAVGYSIYRVVTNAHAGFKQLHPED